MDPAEKKSADHGHSVWEVISEKEDSCAEEAEKENGKENGEEFTPVALVKYETEIDKFIVLEDFILFFEISDTLHSFDSVFVW